MRLKMTFTILFTYMYRVTFSSELKKSQNITVLDGNKDNFYIIASTYRNPLNVV